MAAVVPLLVHPVYAKVVPMFLFVKVATTFRAVLVCVVKLPANVAPPCAPDVSVKPIAYMFELLVSPVKLAHEDDALNALINVAAETPRRVIKTCPSFPLKATPLKAPVAVNR